MANFKMSITNEGKKLLAKGMAGKTIHFAKIKLGDGNYSGSTTAIQLMINEKLSLDVKNITRKDDSVTVRGVMLFEQVTNGFYWRELGVFALDPDTSQEVLYAYANAGDQADYIPSNDSSTIIEKNISVTMLVFDTINVTATVDDSLIFASKNDLDALAAQKSDKSKVVDFTLTAGGWSGQTAPCTQTAAISGLKSTDTGYIGLKMGLTATQRSAASDAAFYIVSQQNGSVTICAEEQKPTIDIPSQMIIIY